MMPCISHENGSTDQLLGQAPVPNPFPVPTVMYSILVKVRPEIYFKNLLSNPGENASKESKTLAHCTVVFPKYEELPRVSPER